MTRRFHPFSSSINTAFRNWTDTNNNYIPDCDVQNFSAQDLSGSGGDVCGAISNVNFGKFIPSATLFDDSVLNDNRDFLWDINFDLQHELTRGLSLNAGYNHNWDGSFTVTENTLYGPEAFDEFCVTLPNDPRLGSGAGTQQCGYYDVQPQFFGKGTLRVTNAKEFVGQNGNTRLPQRYWDGIWIGLDGRLPYNIRVGGGLDMGRQVDDHCFTVDAPNQPRDITGSGGALTWSGFAMSGTGMCRVVTSWADTMDIRLNGSIPIKGGFNGSFIYRNTVGANQNATLTVAPANVTFKNGRASSTFTTAQAIAIRTPNSVYGPRFSQLDLAINKTLDIGWGKVRVAFDVYNALNSNSVQNVTTTYGQRWLRPATFLDPRLARVTAALSF